MSETAFAKLVKLLDSENISPSSVMGTTTPMQLYFMENAHFQKKIDDFKSNAHICELFANGATKNENEFNQIITQLVIEREEYRKKGFSDIIIDLRSEKGWEAQKLADKMNEGYEAKKFTQLDVDKLEQCSDVIPHEVAESIIHAFRREELIDEGGVNFLKKKYETLGWEKLKEFTEIRGSSLAQVNAQDRKSLFAHSDLLFARKLANIEEGAKRFGWFKRAEGLIAAEEFGKITEQIKENRAFFLKENPDKMKGKMKEKVEKSLIANKNTYVEIIKNSREQGTATEVEYYNAWDTVSKVLSKKGITTGNFAMLGICKSPETELVKEKPNDFAERMQSAVSKIDMDKKENNAFKKQIKNLIEAHENLYDEMCKGGSIRRHSRVK